MIDHLNNSLQNPERVVILGSSGFIGLALANALQKEGIEIVPLASHNLDLTDCESATNKLLNIIKPTDAVVFLSVIGPNRGHDSDALIKNIQMARAVGEALRCLSCAQLIYISSEAVYSTNDSIINELTAPSPNTLYGVMHLTREIMLREMLADMVPLLLLRLTQVYGQQCTHNAYGPNRFIRQAHQSKQIDMFGEGEENRDFIYIDDVVKILMLALQSKSVGVANVATGKTVTYKQLARVVQQQFKNEAITVASKPRAIGITHKHFDIKGLLSAYPGLKFTPLKDGVAAMIAQEFSHA